MTPTMTSERTVCLASADVNKDIEFYILCEETRMDYTDLGSIR